MRRPPLIASLILVPLSLAFAVGGLMPNSADEAADAARKAAGTAGERLSGMYLRTAAEVGYEASRIEGVEALRVTGTAPRDGDGIEVVVRTSGSAYNGWFDVETVTVRRCFAVRVAPGAEGAEEPRDVDCPDGPLPVFAPPPAPPRLPHGELRARLPRVPEGGRADEAEVRRVLAALGLDQGIRTEVGAEGGRVGVALTVERDPRDPQDCVLARVAPGSTEVWTPPRIQRMPGEGGCSVGNALRPAPLPH